MIIVAINYANYPEGSKKYIQELAISILATNKPSNCQCISFNFKDEKVAVPSSFLVHHIERDSSKTIGSNRRLPYIKEILDLCVNMDCDIFGYVNSDILLSRKFFGFLDGQHDAYLFTRMDLEDVNISRELFTSKNFSDRNLLIRKEEHNGHDAVFFDKNWWTKNRKKFHNDFILGEPFWDLYYNKIVVENTKNYLLERALYHIYHPTTWSIKSKGGINNSKILNGH